MSQYIPAEREHVYRKFGVEDALEDMDPRVFRKQIVVDNRDDSFGNHPFLEWDPVKQIGTLSVAGVPVSVPGERAHDAIYHTYPVLYAKLGEATVNTMIGKAA